MCVNPRVLDNGLLVSCRVCWQCRESYINDWAGRCTAESEDAVATHLVTLTYGGGDHFDARVLNYEHIRVYLRRIRDAGYPIRYFCVGEYGAKKGRSHWHMILFWQDKVPPFLDQFDKVDADTPKEAIRLDWSYNQYFWPHGHSKYEVADHNAARYVMKYMLKDFRDAGDDAAYGMSSKPMLGSRFFLRLARLYVDNQLAPQDKIYRIPGVKHKRDDRPAEFYMSRNVWLFICQAYLDEWARRYPGQHRPTSAMLDDYEDLIAKQARPDPLEYAPRVQEPVKPWLCPRTGRRYHDGDTQAPIGWSRELQVWYFPPQPEPHLPTLYWSFDDDGNPSWQKSIRTAIWAERRKAALELRKASGETYETLSRGR